MDLGTTYTAAAVARAGRAEILSLGQRSPSVPSVLYLDEDGTFLAGPAATRRALTDPRRVAREFKRRLGDPTPVLLAGAPHSAESLMAKMLRWVHDVACEREGGSPDVVALTHPANWGPYKTDLLGQAVRMAGLDGAVTLTEPEAAAWCYANGERVDPGETVAVYDLGGGTFDAAVLRRTDAGFEILGPPEGVERLGGIDVDEAVFDLVRNELGVALDELDPDDPTVMGAVARLRDECVQAKEALAQDTRVVVPVILPGLATEVAITRDQLADMAQPIVQQSLEALHRCLAGAGVTGADLEAVLLVGGSSRLPGVADRVSAEVGRPVAVDIHPKHAVSMGAALAAEAMAGGSQAATRATAPTVTRQATTLPPRTTLGETVGGEVPPTASPTAKRSPGRGVLIGGGLAAVALLGGLAVALTSGGGTGSNDRETVNVERAGASSSTLAPATTVVADPNAPPTTTGPPRIVLERVEIRPGEQNKPSYFVTFRTEGFVHRLGDPGTFHVHFFWDTVPEEKATFREDTGGFAESTVNDIPNPFETFPVEERPEGANGICAVVTDHSHRIIGGSGNCVALPRR